MQYQGIMVSILGLTPIPENNYFSPKAVIFLYQLNDFDATKITDKTQLKNWQLDGGVYRGFVTEISVDGKSYRVIAAMDMSFHKQFLDKLTVKMWLMMFAIGIITIGATWLGIYQGHRPLKMLSRQIRNIQTHQLDERLNPTLLPIELRNLAISFNQMLQHLEEDFERLSNFSADIAYPWITLSVSYLVYDTIPLPCTT